MGNQHRRSLGDAAQDALVPHTFEVEGHALAWLEPELRGALARRDEGVLGLRVAEEPSGDRLEPWSGAIRLAPAELLDQVDHLVLDDAFEGVEAVAAFQPADGDRPFRAAEALEQEGRGDRQLVAFRPARSVRSVPRPPDAKAAAAARGTRGEPERQLQAAQRRRDRCPEEQGILPLEHDGHITRADPRELRFADTGRRGEGRLPDLPPESVDLGGHPRPGQEGVEVRRLSRSVTIGG